MCNLPRWLQRLGWRLQRHRRRPQQCPSRSIQSKLSTHLWDPWQHAPAGALPWLLRAWRPNNPLATPSYPSSHQPAIWRKKAETKRGRQSKLGSPGRSMGFPWRLYRSSWAWHKYFKNLQNMQNMQNMRTYRRSLQASSASTSLSFLGANNAANLGKIFWSIEPIPRWIMK